MGDFIRVKSYKGTESSGDVKITTLGADIGKLQGKHCLLVEDIIDSGLTMSRLVPYLETLQPKSVKVASLLEKRTSRSCGFLADYVGFSIPDKFVIGYCLDYNEVYRDMLHIGVITPLGIERFKDGPPPLETEIENLKIDGGGREEGGEERGVGGGEVNLMKED